MRGKLVVGSVMAAALLAILSFSPSRSARATAIVSPADASRTPVLVELFTSEGCSDCPPADALLEKLDRSLPVDGASVVVLSEHVDYWNDIGWSDPYSSREFSERQAAYAERFRLPSVYTPQMVVDGRFQLVGSDESGAVSAIEDATKAQKASVTLSSVRWESPNSIALHVETGPMPPSIDTKSAAVWIAAADDTDRSSVTSGENGGRTLTHVAVLRTLVRAGIIDRSSGFSGNVSVRLNPAHARDMRLIAFIQEPAAGRVWGIALARLSN
ncbi:MAG TPA: DUF1223 domain-containing protein [Candidatus Aquilonibacter sp.]|nr:DUF1223 domain-containing protein [Candidatus Aquilonibacter sp.]